MCMLMGSDFIRGVNYASKKRPLLEYWFRTPPKNIIEVVIKPGAAGLDSDIDPVLLELEKNWKPLGHVDQNKYLGVGDRFEDGQDLPELPPTPPDQKRVKGRKVDKLDIALIDKMKRQKRQRLKEKKKANQERRLEEQKLNSVDRDLPLNNDMIDIIEDDGSISPTKASKKGKKKGGKVGGAVKRSRSRTKNEA